MMNSHKTDASAKHSLLGRLFRPSPAPLNLEQRIAELRRAAKWAQITPDAGQPFHKAGDLCAQEGNDLDALMYYGRAIDAYLQAGRGDAAAAICRKLLRLLPAAVRAHHTLACIAIGKGLVSQAAQHIADYAEAAYLAVREPTAIQHLERMVDKAGTRPLAEAIAEALAGLGAAQAANDLFGRAHRLPTLAPDANSPKWEDIVEMATFRTDESQPAIARRAPLPPNTPAPPSTNTLNRQTEKAVVGNVIKRAVPRDRALPKLQVRAVLRTEQLFASAADAVGTIQ